MTDSTEPTEEFADLLATSEDPKKPEVGDSVTGTVAQIGPEEILVDFGGKQEGVIARAELLDKKGSLTVKIGDAVQATVVSLDGGLKLSRRPHAAAGGDASKVKEMLIEAQKNRTPVEGRVTASVKGGYEVLVSGVRGFCPFSMIDLKRQHDPTLYFNKTFQFRVKEYTPRKKNLILSRRAILEQEAKKIETEARARITPGAVVKGTVASLHDFGAFIDLGANVQGLLHVSELSHKRVSTPADVLSAGQEVDVQVLRVDKKTRKISLTRKPLEQDPWHGVSTRFRKGQILQPKVVRVTEFGAFCELGDGIDGLLHVSELGAHGRKAEDVVKVGEAVKVQIISVEEKRRRISLGLAPDDVAVGAKLEVAALKVGQIVTGKVERIEKFGVFVRMGAGSTGMIPSNELNVPRGADIRKAISIGSEIRAEVIERDKAGRKIRLSARKATVREEREAIDRYRKDANKSGAGSFSTLGDAFDAFNKSRDQKP